MAKEKILREIYNIIDSITVFALKPFDKFYAEHKDKSEAELSKMLGMAKKITKIK